MYFFFFFLEKNVNIYVLKFHLKRISNFGYVIILLFVYLYTNAYIIYEGKIFFLKILTSILLLFFFITFESKH